MKRLVAALGFFILLTSPAFATSTLTTPMIFIPLNQFISCSFVNVSSKPLDVTINIFETNGDHDSSKQFLATPPGTGGALAISDLSNFAYCTFVVSGGAKSIRGSAAVLDPTTGPHAALPAS